jgi:Phytanoyl-CoA dioxygenase (PhyH)
MRPATSNAVRRRPLGGETEDRKIAFMRRFAADRPQTQDVTSLENLLTPGQIDQFSREGFLALRTPLIEPSELGWCRDVLMRLIKDGAGRKEGRNFDLLAREGGTEATSPQVLKPSLYAEELRQFSYRKLGLEIARQLIGPTASLAGDVAVFKPSYRGGATPWHQDEAFREANFDYQEVSIWIALTDTNRDNGPMAYIPGSHQLGILPHRLQDGSKQANSIECYEGFDPKSAVVCPITAGAMIIHHCRTVHGALENKTNSERLAYVLTYSTPIVLRKEFREFPWLKNLRTSVLRERKISMLRGGIFREIIRVMRSDRSTTRKAIAAFVLRRKSQLLRVFNRR